MKNRQGMQGAQRLLLIQLGITTLFALIEIIMGDTTAAISAAAGGLVVTQEFHSAYGNMIEIEHGDQVISRYAHSSKVFVKKGDLIKRGQKIALVGATGRTTGPHLHYEVLVQGIPQDPRKFLNAGLALRK